MNIRTEMRDFLSSRRAKVSPESAGLPAGAGRRVQGLRREEVATLAGVSITYYVRLERGDAAGVSPEVLDAVARVLQLTEVERQHLHNLARAIAPSPRAHRPKPVPALRPGVQRLLDALDDAPAFVRNARLDVVAINPLGRALYRDLYDPALGNGPANLARYCFLDARAHDFYPNWDLAADQTVALLHAAAAADPADQALTGLVGELSTRTVDFAARWARHDVRNHDAGSKTFHHPIVGTLSLTYESMDLAAAPGLALLAYTAEPDTADADALRLLAAWAVTEQPTTQPA